MSRKHNLPKNVGVLRMAERMIEENEGYRSLAYSDTVGKTTIGFGRNLDDTGISWEEAKLLMANDLIKAHNRLHGELDFYQRLSDPRKAVMVDMYHNLGLRGLMSFKKMLKAVQLGQWDEAANEIKDSRYFDQVGERAKRNYCMMKFNQWFEKADASKSMKK